MKRLVKERTDIWAISTTSCREMFSMYFLSMYSKTRWILLRYLAYSRSSGTDRFRAYSWVMMDRSLMRFKRTKSSE